MKKELRVIELFAGIGAPRKALINGGYNFKVVDSIEIDKYPVASYNALYGESIVPTSITDYFPTKETVGEIDLIWNSSPCQDISQAGKQAGAVEGTGTRSSLIYEVIRIVKDLQPKFIVWENVRNLVAKKHRPVLDDYIDKLSDLGYVSYFEVLNSMDYDIPQNRNRVFVVSIRKDLDKGYFNFPVKRFLYSTMKDYLEDDVDDKYFLSRNMITYVSKPGTKNYGSSDCRINLDVARTLTTDQGKRAGVTNYLCKDLPDNYNLVDYDGVVEDLPIRKLTPRECWRLMGFTDEDFDKAQKVNSNTQLYKQAGNSVVVNVIEAVFNELLKDYQ